MTSVFANLTIGLFDARHEQLLLHAIERHGGALRRLAVDDSQRPSSHLALQQCHFIVCSPAYFAKMQHSIGDQVSEYGEIRSTQWLQRCIKARQMLDIELHELLQRADGMEDDLSVAPHLEFAIEPPAGVTSGAAPRTPTRTLTPNTSSPLQAAGRSTNKDEEMFEAGAQPVANEQRAAPSTLR